MMRSTTSTSFLRHPRNRNANAFRQLARSRAESAIRAPRSSPRCVAGCSSEESNAQLQRSPSGHAKRGLSKRSYLPVRSEKLLLEQVRETITDLYRDLHGHIDGLPLRALRKALLWNVLHLFCNVCLQCLLHDLLARMDLLVLGVLLPWTLTEALPGEALWRRNVNELFHEHGGHNFASLLLDARNHHPRRKQNSQHVIGDDATSEAELNKSHFSDSSCFKSKLITVN